MARGKRDSASPLRRCLSDSEQLAVREPRLALSRHPARELAELGVRTISWGQTPVLIFTIGAYGKAFGAPGTAPSGEARHHGGFPTVTREELGS